jgi:EAL and modified HD-GYP domain-containing signal transduction protein
MTPAPGPDSRVLFARQPIVDLAGAIAGFELLFRRADGTAGAIEDAERATAQVLVGALAELPLDEATGGRPAWIEVSREFLLTVDPLPVAPGRVVLELAAGPRVDFVLLRRLRELRAEGHQIALDDFVWAPELTGLLGLATHVKLDVRALGPAQLARQAGLAQHNGAAVVAEGVETHEERDRCAALGIGLLQGSFFARPAPMSGRPLGGGGGAATLRTLAAVQAARGFDQLEAVIAQDAGLAVRLLRCVNSAGVGLPHRVASIRQALVLLGETGVRQWATLVALSGLGAPRPALLATALVRARTCEALAVDAGAPAPEAWFAAGLLSVADALAGAPLAAALDDLPLTDELRAALLERTGPIGHALEQACRLERAEGPLPEAPARHLPAAARWADAALGTVRAAA